MKQHFRGHFEGQYVGTNAPHASSGKATYQIQVYQGVVRELAWHAPPSELDEKAKSPGSVHQADLPRTRLTAVPGRGDSYDAHVFDLEIHEPRFSHPARHEGRIYGCITGLVTGWFNLPPEPAPPEESEPATRVTAPALERAKGKKAEASLLNSAVGLGAATQETPDSLPSEEDAAPDAPKSEAEAKAAPPALPAVPLTALVIAIAIALLVTCSAADTGLWLLFLVPTLVVRRFLRGVLEDSLPLRAIAALLVLAQLGWTSWLLVEWSSAPCKELHIIPVLGLIAGVFLSGILPFAAPFALNAAGFALVLWSFGSEPSAQCDAKIQVPVEMPRPSVKHPGVPRTNPDGRWPRSPAR